MPPRRAFSTSCWWAVIELASVRGVGRSAAGDGDCACGVAAESSSAAMIQARTWLPVRAACRVVLRVGGIHGTAARRHVAIDLVARGAGVGEVAGRIGHRLLVARLR